MGDTTSTLLTDLPKLLCLAIAVIGGLFALSTWWRRQRAVESLAVRSVAAATANQIVYRDAPTVRVVDSQRIDRIRKLVHLAPGEFVDILENYGGPIPRFRLTLKDVIAGDAPHVRLLVDYGGTPLSCGPLVREVGTNEFIMPRVARDEPRASILHFHERGDTLDFMRIKLRGVDPVTNTAELDVLQVSGHWPMA